MLTIVSENSEEPLHEWVAVQYALTKALKETQRQTPASVEWRNKAEPRTSEEKAQIGFPVSAALSRGKMLSWSLKTSEPTR